MNVASKVFIVIYIFINSEVMLGAGGFALPNENAFFK